MRITLVGYRANGSDYCRGHVTDRSDSDFFIFDCGEDINEAARLMATYDDVERDRGPEYEPWEYKLLVDGCFDEGENVAVRNSVDDAYGKFSTALYDKRKKAAEEEKARQEALRLKLERNLRYQKFLDLKREFDPDGSKS